MLLLISKYHVMLNRIYNNIIKPLIILFIVSNKLQIHIGVIYCFVSFVLSLNFIFYFVQGLVICLIYKHVLGYHNMIKSCKYPMLKFRFQYTELIDDTPCTLVASRKPKNTYWVIVCLGRIFSQRNCKKNFTAHVLCLCVCSECAWTVSETRMMHSTHTHTMSNIIDHLIPSSQGARVICSPITNGLHIHKSQPN